MAGVRAEVSGRAEGLRGSGRTRGADWRRPGRGVWTCSGRCGDLWKVWNQVSDATGSVLQKENTGRVKGRIGRVE